MLDHRTSPETGHEPSHGPEEFATTYGRVRTNGTSFRVRAERRQREYRAQVLQVGWRGWGHLLEPGAADAGRNFLTDAALRAARRRELAGKGVDHQRTFGNMLSSQAMCF